MSDNNISIVSLSPARISADLDVTTYSYSIIVPKFIINLFLHITQNLLQIAIKNKATNDMLLTIMVSIRVPHLVMTENMATLND